MSKQALDEITDKVLSFDPTKPVQEGPLKVIAGAPDKPLTIGDFEIPCYVLEDETRVLSQRGVFSSFNFTQGGPRGGHDDPGAQMPRFAGQKWIRSFINNELETDIKTPILFRMDTGQTAYGYPATLLVSICKAILDAHQAGVTTPRQDLIVERATVLIGALAEVGIIALVDEATGYQRIREERALATILEKIIAKELQPWTKTFPYGFYEQIFRLKGWGGPDGVKRPSVIGKYTKDIVYDRLDPGVLEELKRVDPKDPDTGKWFIPEIGHPKLLQHIEGVTAIMRLSHSWETFIRNLGRVYPKCGETRDIIPDNDQDR